MQPRSLSQILSELDTVYSPQIESIRARQAAIPGQIQAEEQGLQAKQTQAYDDILNGARRRGLGFSGIPLGEQAKYSSTEYLPALARLRQSGREQAVSLEDAILGIQERRQNQGQGIYQYETSLAEQQRQFNEQLAEQRRQAAAANSFKWPTAPQQAPQGNGLLPGMTLKNAAKGGAGGYNFSFGGKPISAVGLAQVSGANPADVLYSMAQSGDTYAANAYREIVNNKGQITPAIAQKYYSLFWGTNMLPTPAKPAPAKTPLVTSAKTGFASQPSTSVLKQSLANARGY